MQSYLAGVRHATLLDLAGGKPVFRTSSGSARLTAPAQMDFWVAQSSGSADRAITWPVQNGEWTAVVMSAASSSGVTVDTGAGAEVSALPWVIGILLTLAGVALAFAVILISVSLRATSRRV